MPGGVSSVNDGMPTQMPSPGGSRQSSDSIGIMRRRVERSSRSGSSRVELVVAAGERRAAREVRQVRAVRCDVARVVDGVAVRALERVARTAPARPGGSASLSTSGVAGPSLLLRRPTARSRRASWRSPGSACWRARGRSTPRTARGRCRARRPRCVSVLSRPGTTSVLPASSGTQKLWITLQSPFADAGVVARRRARGARRRPVGMRSSLAVTTLPRVRVARTPTTTACPTTVDLRARSAPGFSARSKIVRDGRHRDDREDQRRDDRPADLERRVAVDLLRVLVRRPRGGGTGRRRRRGAEDEHADRRPRSRRSGMKRLSIVLGVRALRARASSARCRGPDSRARREDEGRTDEQPASDQPTAAPARRCGASSPLPDAPGSRSVARPERVGTLSAGILRRSNSAAGVRASRAQNPSRSRRVGAALPVALDPDPRSPGSTRAPRSASSSLRARGAGLLQHRAALADHDPLLGLALDPDRRPAAAGRRRGCVARRRRRAPRPSTADRVRQLVAGDAQQLLAQQLGGEERLGLVGDHAVRVVVRALGQPGLELADERVDAVAGAAPTAARRRRSRRARRRDREVLGDRVAARRRRSC